MPNNTLSDRSLSRLREVTTIVLGSGSRRKERNQQRRGGVGTGGGAPRERFGRGILTAGADEAVYDDATNTLTPASCELRIWKTGTVVKSGLRIVDDAYWDDDEKVTVNEGRARLCFWFLEDNSHYHVFPSCHEVAFDKSEPAITTDDEQEIEEGDELVAQLTGTDLDTYDEAEVDTPRVEWMIMTGAGFGVDGALFEVVDSGGNPWLKFRSPPEFADPGDADTDNVYEVTVRAENWDGQFDDLLILVTVTEAP